MMYLALFLLWLIVSLIGGLIVGSAIALRDEHRTKPIN